MSINAIFSTGLSALQVNQKGLSVTSQNVANAGTAGYARVELQTAPRFIPGQGGSGVEVSGLRRAADRFLASAALTAESRFGADSARAQLLDRAQASFGDPAAATSTFGKLDIAFASLDAAAADPASSLQRGRAVSDLEALFSDLARVGREIGGLRSEAEARITESARAFDGLLQSVADLNTEIQVTLANGGDPTGAENAQAQLIEQMSAFLGISMSPNLRGGVELRTASGELLLGERAAQVVYTPSDSAAAIGGTLSLIGGDGQPRPLDLSEDGGAIAGYVYARDQELPQLLDALGQLSAATAEALNAAHNDSAAVPAPSALSGRVTGLEGADALGFTGGATIGLVSADGVLESRIEIDFDTGQLRLDGGAWTAIPAAGAEPTIDEFVAALDGVTGLSASFSDGRLQISAPGGEGMVIRQGAEGLEGSDRAGRGFSHFFGLNDLVGRDQPISFETGLSGSQTGFDSGELVLRIRDPQGRVLSEPTITAAGGDIDAFFAQVNAAIGGAGQISLDANGAAQLSPASGYTIEVLGDTTSRGGVSFSNLFGVGATARAGRATTIDVAPAIAAAPERLALAQPDLTAELGERVLEAGDGRGGVALSAAKDAPRSIPAAGGLGARSDSVLGYAAAVGGLAGRLSADADAARASSEQISIVARERRDSAQAVNLDEELLNMTEYQQAYAAAARVIDAAKEMMDVLLQLV